MKAFRDFEPVTFSADRGIYRTVRWGKNLQMFFLDERSFRSGKASANHVCDNPRHRPAGPGADGAGEHPQRFLRAGPLALPAGLAGLQGQDQQPQPSLPRRGAAQPVRRRRQELECEVEGGHERDPHPAVLRPAVRPLGGLRDRARAAAARAADRQRQPPRLPDHRHPRGARQRGPLPDPAGRRRARQRSDDRPLQHPLPGLRHRPRGHDSVLAGDRRGYGQNRQRQADLERLLQATAAERHGHGMRPGRREQLRRGDRHAAPASGSPTRTRTATP